MQKLLPASLGVFTLLALAPALWAATESLTFAADGAKSAAVEFSFPMGKLHLEAGDTPLMDATFTYSQPEWRPETNYAVKDKRGYLTMSVPVSIKKLNKGDDNRWEIQLTETLPLDLEIDMGVGEGHFDLRGLKLGRVDLDVGVGQYHIDLAGASPAQLELNSGVGEVKVDLSGDWHNGLEGRIRCGIGELTVTLPRQTGVRVKVSGLLGSVEADEFIRQDDTYTNSAYEGSEYILDIDIARGIGGINLKLAD